MMATPTNGRRRFLRSIAGTGGAAITATLLPGGLMAQSHLLQPADPAKGHIFLTQPYLQDPSPDGMVVRWITNLPSYSWVEFGDTPALGRKAHSITNGLVDAYNRVNRIRLNGLKPASACYYRICSKEITGFEPYQLTYGGTIRSEVFSFSTPGEENAAVSMLILNDIHDRPRSIPHLLNMHGTDPCDFVFFNGDVFDFQSGEQQIIDHMLTPCTDTFASTVPFLYVRGNHETRGNFRQHLPDYFSNPGERQYFSFTRGPVHFTVLDTGDDKPDDTPVYAGIVDFDAYRREQARWLGQVVDTKVFKKAAFRVVLMHIPPYYAGEWHGTVHCRELFSPIFNKHKVDLCIAGHTHQYGVHHPVAGEHDYPLIIGGGPEEGKRTLITLKADHRQLNLTMLDDNKKEVGQYLVKK